jgi:hypothetical protein
VKVVGEYKNLYKLAKKWKWDKIRYEYYRQKNREAVEEGLTARTIIYEKKVWW